MRIRTIAVSACLCALIGCGSRPVHPEPLSQQPLAAKPTLTSSGTGLPLPAVNVPMLLSLTSDNLSVAAIVAGVPSAVQLIYRNPSGAELAKTLEPNGDFYRGTILASQLSEGRSSYRLVATYDDTELSSEPYTLVRTASIDQYVLTAARTVRKVLVSRPWGVGAGRFGRSGGNQEATVTPVAIATDKLGVVVLDGVRQVLERFSTVTGVSLGTVKVASKIASDLSTDANGDLLVTSQPEGTVERIRGVRSLGLTHVDLSGYPLNVRVGAVGQTLSALDGHASRLVALVQSGQATSAQQQIAAAGTSTDVPLIALDPADSGIRIALPGDGHVMEIHSPYPVLSVDEEVLGTDGRLWLLAGAQLNGGVQQLLIAVNRATHVAQGGLSDMLIPGDSTRRMTAVGDGLAMFEGDASAGMVSLYSLR